MGLTLTLTDAELPASPVFIEFLYDYLTKSSFHVGEWFHQEGEGMAREKDRFHNIREQAKYVLSQPEGNTRIVQAYRYFKELLTGKPNSLLHMQRYHFFFIIGIPRTGGTYLTKQLFRAADIDYTKVQNALAHDGFPHLTQLEMKEEGNSHTNGLLQLAEYLTMVDMYYGACKPLYRGKIIVPKKLTKAIYNFPLIKEIFNHHATYLVTLRHPLPVIQSVLDKSGGMPKEGNFAVRSNIERWALEAWLQQGFSEKEVEAKSYMQVMLTYWKIFHYQLALTGLPKLPNALLVPYGAGFMTYIARKIFKVAGISLEPEPFLYSKPLQFDKAVQHQAENALEEVRQVWESLGLEFPLKSSTG